jgi:hypothetical protein
MDWYQVLFLTGMTCSVACGVFGVVQLHRLRRLNAHDPQARRLGRRILVTGQVHISVAIAFGFAIAMMDLNAGSESMHATTSAAILIASPLPFLATYLGCAHRLLGTES